MLDFEKKRVLIDEDEVDYLLPINKKVSLGGSNDLKQSLIELVGAIGYPHQSQ